MQPLDDNDVAQRRADVTQVKTNGFEMAEQTGLLLVDIAEQLSLSNQNFATITDVNQPSHLKTLADTATQSLAVLKEIAYLGKADHPLHVVVTHTDKRVEALAERMT